ncbi:M56 family metallopeptidase [Stieleria varia]|uniref:BlaR1 peptidase M56 n=1 Tax=Stieleria varia TaxID=2528005 RepID=A0A5C6AFT9_9BACT|nr:M56 family metallopeptidase [Stieleria varia]TWT98469.1 BlaR1 peptidase M56 [Stieleria varia]
MSEPVAAFSLHSPLIVTTMMLASCGLVVAWILRTFQIRSLRLRSVLITGVLLQGAMFARIPIHLGLWESNSAGHVDVVLDESSLPSSSLGGLPNQASSFDACVGEMANGEAVRSAENGSALGLLGNGDVAVLGRWFAAMEWQRITTVLWFVWAVGVLLLVTRTIFTYLRMLHHVRRLPLADQKWQRDWRTVLRTHGVASRVCPVLQSESVGPMLVRLPDQYALVIPRAFWERLTDIQRQAVMTHEAQHLSRRDVWRQLAARFIATIHWFNPVAWWAVRRLDQTAELACDRAVAQRGNEYSAGFAGALLMLVSDMPAQNVHQVACTAMATPPLTRRITDLLHPSGHKDSVMKSLALLLLSVVVVMASCIQFRLTAADTTTQDSRAEVGSGDALPVIDDAELAELVTLFRSLDDSDGASKQLLALTESTGGKLALSGYIDQLRGDAMRSIKDRAIEVYGEAMFEKSPEGLRLRDQGKADKWTNAARRLDESVRGIQAAASETVKQLDDSSNAGVLLKRFLSDKEASIALLLFEMDSGGDPVAAFINKALTKILVQRGDGQYQVIASAKAEAEKEAAKFETAALIAKRLKKQLPIFAGELDMTDETSKRFADYLNKPLMSNVIAIELANKNGATPVSAVEKLFESLESACQETANGLRLRDGEVRDKVDELCMIVDRAETLVQRTGERLIEIADSMADDEVSQRLAAVMRQDLLATLVAAEIPYSDSMAGDELRTLLTQVLEKGDSGGLVVRSDRADELSEKMSELLETCRSIRRYAVMVDELLEQMADQELVAKMGDVGRYLILDEVRRYVESARPDAVTLVREHLVQDDGKGTLTLRDSSRVLIAQLTRQADRLNQASPADDF